MNVNVELIGFEKIVKQLDPKAHKVIAVRSVNKLAALAKTAADKSIRGDYRIKKKDLGLKLQKAKGKYPVAVIKGKSEHLSMTKFPAKQTKQGTSVEMRKGRKVMYTHAFIATMKSAHQSIFVRSMKGGERAGRLPIRELKGPSTGQLLLRNETIEAIDKVVKTRSKDLFLHEIDYYFNKLRR